MSALFTSQSIYLLFLNIADTDTSDVALTSDVEQPPLLDLYLEGQSASLGVPLKFGCLEWVRLSRVHDPRAPISVQVDSVYSSDWGQRSG